MKLVYFVIEVTCERDMKSEKIDIYLIVTPHLQRIIMLYKLFLVRDVMHSIHTLLCCY